MLDMNDLKIGVTFKFNQEPYIVIKAAHLKMGRGSAVLQAKIKNLQTGATLERNFKPADKFEEADLEKKRADFLYTDKDKIYFMDDNYEQFFVDYELVKTQLNFLKESTSVNVLFFEGKAIGVELPPKVELKVTQAPPAVRGDTAQGSVTKTVSLETGAQINVPLFIKEGDIIRINTESGEYVERVNK